MASKLPSLVLLMVALPLVISYGGPSPGGICPRTTADRVLDRGAAERCLQSLSNSVVANPGGSNENYIAGVETTFGQRGTLKNML
jgi:hypothetical protein